MEIAQIDLHENPVIERSLEVYPVMLKNEYCVIFLTQRFIKCSYIDGMLLATCQYYKILVGGVSTHGTVTKQSAYNLPATISQMWETNM